MTNDEFINIALSVFGDEWAYQIHKRLGISIRTVQRWGSGKMPIPDAVAGIMRYWMGGLNG